MQTISDNEGVLGPSRHEKDEVVKRELVQFKYWNDITLESCNINIIIILTYRFKHKCIKRCCSIRHVSILNWSPGRLCYCRGLLISNLKTLNLSLGDGRGKNVN